MEEKQSVPQLQEVKPPPKECPVPPPCPVCPPKPKPWQVCLKIFLLLLSGLVLALIILAASGLRITRKESLLDVWLASRKGTPTPEIIEPTPTPTPDPTANWKTYADKDALFSLKYPRDWVIDVGGGTGNVKTLASSSEAMDCVNVAIDELCLQVWMEGSVDPVRPVVIEKTLADFIDKKFGKYPQGDGTYESIDYTETEVNGFKAARFINKEKLFVVVHRENAFYTLSAFPVNSSLLPVFDQILSTFKFLDEGAVETEGGKTIVVPSNWKEFSDEDWDYNFKVSLSLPPGFSFSFSGSEWMIKNDSDSTELWDYSPRTDYDGGSRRAWYQKVFPNNKIVSVVEKELNDNSYLDLSIEIPKYDDHGVVSGTQIVSHYLYVKDNIAHLITPVSRKAYSKEAVIPENIAPILVSLKLTRTK